MKISNISVFIHFNQNLEDLGRKYQVFDPNSSGQNQDDYVQNLGDSGQKSKYLWFLSKSLTFWLKWPIYGKKSRRCCSKSEHFGWYLED